jgi:hypothetical protein
MFNLPETGDCRPAETKYPVPGIHLIRTVDVAFHAALQDARFRPAMARKDASRHCRKPFTAIGLDKS